MTDAQRMACTMQKTFMIRSMATAAMGKADAVLQHVETYGDNVCKEGMPLSLVQMEDIVQCLVPLRGALVDLYREVSHMKHVVCLSMTQSNERMPTEEPILYIVEDNLLTSPSPSARGRSP